MGKGRPTGGYNFETKRSYRRKVWDAVEEQLKMPRKKIRAFVLDTGEGLETRELLRRGYRPEHIHAVNKNPAEVAHLTRGLDRDGLPRVQTHGRDLVDALQPFCDRREYPDVINFDGCASIGWGNDAGPCDSWEDVKNFWGWYLYAVAISLRPGGVLAHTMLVGRERGETRDAFILPATRIEVVDHGRVVSGTYLRRIQAALTYVMTGGRDACHIHVRDLAYDWYASSAGTQRMIWFAAKLGFHEPVSARQYLDMVRRKYHQNPDRMLALMMPRCIRMATRDPDEPAFPHEQDVLYSHGAKRFRGIHKAPIREGDEFPGEDEGGAKKPAPPMRV